MALLKWSKTRREVGNPDQLGSRSTTDNVKEKGHASEHEVKQQPLLSRVVLPSSSSSSLSANLGNVDQGSNPNHRRSNNKQHGHGKEKQAERTKWAKGGKNLKATKILRVLHEDLIGDAFWDARPWLLSG